jgi:hypothetical protein
VSSSTTKTPFSPTRRRPGDIRAHGLRPRPASRQRPHRRPVVTSAHKPFTDRRSRHVTTAGWSSDFANRFCDPSGEAFEQFEPPLRQKGLSARTSSPAQRGGQPGGGQAAPRGTSSARSPRSCYVAAPTRPGGSPARWSPPSAPRRQGRGRRGCTRATALPRDFHSASCRTPSVIRRSAGLSPAGADPSRSTQRPPPAHHSRTATIWPA